MNERNLMDDFDFFILRGLPGSGKSTWADRQPHPKIILSTDSFFIKLGQYDFDVSKLGEAHAWNFRRAISACTEQLLLDVKSKIYIDNTNIMSIEIAPYWQLAKAYKRKPILLSFPCEPITASQRNIHKVPFDVVLRMYVNLEKEQLPLWWEQNIIDANSNEKPIQKQQKQETGWIK